MDESLAKGKSQPSPEAAAAETDEEEDTFVTPCISSSFLTEDPEIEEDVTPPTTGFILQCSDETALAAHACEPPSLYDNMPGPSSTLSISSSPDLIAPLIKDDCCDEGGWYHRLLRWVPTSPCHLEKAERKVLSYLKSPYECFYIDISRHYHKPSPTPPTPPPPPPPPQPPAGGQQEGVPVPPTVGEFSITADQHGHRRGGSEDGERRIWTLICNKRGRRTPLVLIHGLCSGVGLWILNIDTLAEHRPVYAIDLIGFGRSSRPKFSEDALEAEKQHVEAIEAWRKEMGLEQFILLGHSMGGFISMAYSLRYPSRVKMLIGVDPWGFPEKPQKIESGLPIPADSLTTKAATTIGLLLNPLGLMRAAGPYGLRLLRKVRPDLLSKYEALENGSNKIAEYIFHCNAQDPTGERAFKTMMDFFGWAKNPMCHRIHQLHSSIFLTFIYGEKTWVQQLSEERLKELRPNGAKTEVYIVPNAGHIVYADDQHLFNFIVNHAAAFADQMFNI